MSSAFWRGKKVFVTGHTGFKGSWLSLWLSGAGAQVHGYSTAPPTEPSLFNVARVEDALASHVIGDVRDGDAIKRAMAAAAPEVVFHLAAQSLVRYSYLEPAETYAVNVLGTVNVLEAIRACASVLSVVNVTTDKCYENQEWLWGYRESEPLGGRDPYSSSKACSELVTAAYRDSFFAKASVAIATGRAGNVIGGGDWALDRIVPDCIRALVRGDTIPVRNKVATRPWQHVLEPLSGYLWLGACLSQSAEAEGLRVEGLKGDANSDPVQRFNHSTFQPPLCSAFNFGPALASNRTVSELVQEILKHWPGKWEDKSDPKAVHEATLLNLTTDKAHHFLGWAPAWSFSETIHQTVSWYKQVNDPAANVHALTTQQIAAYTAAAKSAGVAWAN